MIEFLIISLLLALGVCGIAYNSRTEENGVLVPSPEVTRRVLRREHRRETYVGDGRFNRPQR